MARHFKGPWLPIDEAAAYVGRKRTSFRQLLRKCPTLTSARRKQGGGVGRPAYVYPVQALDFAMNEEAPR